MWGSQTALKRRIYHLTKEEGKTISGMCGRLVCKLLRHRRAVTFFLAILARGGDL